MKNKHTLLFCILMAVINQLYGQNVGIGTTTPSAKLDIINTTNSGYTLKIRPANSNGQVWVDSVGNIKMYDPANTTSILINDSSRLSIARTYNVPSNVTTRAMYIQANYINGGGAAIEANLFGNGTGMGTGSSSAVLGTNFMNYPFAYGINGQSFYSHGVNGYTTSSNHAGIYGFSFLGKGVEGSTSSTTAPGGYFSGTNYALTTGNGRVGIGTNTPIAKLELNSQSVSGDAFRLVNKSSLLSAMFDSSGRMLLGDLTSINLYNDTSKLFINNQIGNATNKNGITITSNTTGGFGTGLRSVINGTSSYQNAAINAEDNTIIPGFGGGIGLNSYSQSGYSIFSQSFNGYGAVINSTLGVGADIATQSGTGVIINSVTGLNALEIKNGNTGLGTNTTDAKLHIRPENGNKKIIKVQDFGNNEKLRMDSSGRVLLGDLTASTGLTDTAKMAIYTTVNSSSPIVRPGLLVKTNVQNGYAAGIRSELSSAGIGSAAISGEDITGHPDNIGVYGYSKFGNGVHGYSVSGIAGVFRNELGGTALVTEGKVGIGTYTPQARLEINSPTPNGDLLRIKKSNGNLKMLIDSSGRMMLGDLHLTPLYTDTSKLYVYNAVTDNTGVIKYSLNTSTTVYNGGVAYGINSIIASNTSGSRAIHGSDLSGVPGNIAVGGFSQNGTAINGLSVNSNGGNFFSTTSIGLVAGTSTGLYAIQANGNVNITGKIINEAWQAPSMNAGWTNLDASNFSPIGYYKDKEEVVHLRGVINYNAALPGSGTVIFNLPPGYRSSTSKTMIFPVSNGNSGLGRLNIDANGDVVLVAGTTPGFISLCGITFRAD